MDMERFKEELRLKAGPHGEKAWQIVETWYYREGRSRRLSLHDLRELSKAIADALKEKSPETRLPEERDWKDDFQYERMATTEELFELVKKTSKLLRHARAKNLPEALTLTNALAYLNDSLKIMRRAEVEARLGKLGG